MQAHTSTAALLPVGGRWLIEVDATEMPTVVVTLPDSTTITPAVTTTATGRYQAAHTVTVAGRHVAQVATADDAIDFAAYATAATTAGGMPTVDDVADYMREGAASWETEDLQDALDAEAAAQRSVCRVSAIYPADLRQALFRRVVRNLAMRQLPLAVLQGDAETGSATLPGRDPEVRRFEAPHRRMVVG
ncbi:hypothetical protein ABT023_16270 [Micromonospora sp. NPDC002296]|uniref:hypothetical protein n=1 Tax=Micromonospora sp. NPDC002296 TaxID=3154271 RepID=UPI003323019C